MVTQCDLLDCNDGNQIILEILKGVVLPERFHGKFNSNISFLYKHNIRSCEYDVLLRNWWSYFKRNVTNC